MEPQPSPENGDTASLHVDLPLSPVVLLSPPVPPEAGAASPSDASVAPAADTGTEPGQSGDPPAGGPEAAMADAADAEAGSRAPPSPTFSRQSSSLLLRDVKRSGVRVFAFGRDDCGQLGLGSASDAAMPQCVEALLGKDVVDLSAAAFHSAAVTSDGELFVSGSNTSGELGVRGVEQVLSPTRVAALENHHVDLVSCGASHTLALVDGGLVAACGLAEYGQLGLGPTGVSVDHPRVLKGLKGTHIVRVAAGGNHSLALAVDGWVWSMGDCSFGALGRACEQPDVPRPIARLWPLGVVQIACGENHSAALTLDGRVLMWGRWALALALAAHWCWMQRPDVAAARRLCLHAGCPALVPLKTACWEAGMC